MKKNILNKVFLIGFAAVSTLTGYSQEKPVIFGRTVHSVSPEGMIRCASVEYNEYLREMHPNLIGEKIELNENTVVFRDAFEANQLLTIPVVVHVIHSGQAVGSGANIADGQVLSQIQVLNQDYRRMMGTPGYNTDSVGADTEIEFCLAQKDPNGNPTNGINRVNLGVASWTSENQIRNNVQAVVQWDPTKYYNIYVVNFGGGLSQTLGYAMYPFGTGLPGLYSGSGTNVDDGFVIGYRYFGSRAIFPSGTYASGYDRGRTSTHEMGHALGLIHIWGDPTWNTSIQNYNYNCTVDDFCADTPMQFEENYNCVPNSSCSSADMYRNYMDYTPDSCMNIFTQNQKTRLRQAVQNGIRRSTLLTSGVCEPPASTDKFELGMISLYPNPTSDILNLVVPDNYDLEGNITVFNALGQKMYSSLVSGTNMHSIDVSNFAQGAYFVKIDRENQTKTLQFIKK